jgi:ribonucleoside-triphosphate reductase
MQHKCQALINGKICTVESQDLTNKHSLLFSTKPWNINNNIGTYESGKICGYYLAEGWLETKCNTEISFAINEKQTNIVNEITTFFNTIGCEVKSELQSDVKIYRVTVYGEAAVGFVTQYVRGKSAKEKRLNHKLWNTSDAFRKGMFDGYLNTDGCPSHNIFAHTTNKDIIADFITLASSIGKVLKYRENKNNTRSFKADKSDKMIFTSYELKLYDNCPIVDGYYAIPISNIQLPVSKTDVMYNFTVDTKEHLFELPNGMISHQCCRLRLNTKELRKRGGGLFGSNPLTGSIGVVTINLPRIGYNSETEIDIFNQLKYQMDIAKESLEIKRKVLEKYMDAGLYPYMKFYLRMIKERFGKYLPNHFSTIGLVGMNELCTNFLGKDITSSEGKALSEKILIFMRDTIAEYQEQTGNVYNLEATPAEGTSYRLALIDKSKYPDILVANNDAKEPYYTNSSQLPVGYTNNIFDVLDHQDSLQTKYTGGTVQHLFIGEKIENADAIEDFIKNTFTKYSLPYISLTPTFSICNKHGYISGEHEHCPKCNEPCEIYSRIVGYIRPVQQWNKGKKQEFIDRQELIFNNE